MIIHERPLLLQYVDQDVTGKTVNIGVNVTMVQCVAESLVNVLVLRDILVQLVSRNSLVRTYSCLHIFEESLNYYKFEFPSKKDRIDHQHFTFLNF